MVQTIRKREDIPDCYDDRDIRRMKREYYDNLYREMNRALKKQESKED